MRTKAVSLCACPSSPISDHLRVQIKIDLPKIPLSNTAESLTPDSNVGLEVRRRSISATSGLSAGSAAEASEREVWTSPCMEQDMSVYILFQLWSETEVRSRLNGGTAMTSGLLRAAGKIIFSYSV